MENTPDPIKQPDPIEQPELIEQILKCLNNKEGGTTKNEEQNNIKNGVGYVDDFG